MVDPEREGWDDEDPDALIAIDPRLLESGHLTAAVERAIRNHWPMAF